MLHLGNWQSTTQQEHPILNITNCALTYWWVNGITKLLTCTSLINQPDVQVWTTQWPNEQFQGMVNVINKDKGEIHEEDEIRVNPSPHQVLMIPPKVASHVIKEVSVNSGKLCRYCNLQIHYGVPCLRTNKNQQQTIHQKKRDGIQKIHDHLQILHSLSRFHCMRKW